MASVSSATSSLGNTALKGFGGLASGIDRDSIIEQMTAGTTSKITKQKQEMTKLSWKQEAFRSISDKILDLQDNYLGFSATNSLSDSNFFAKNQITVTGDPNVTKYVKASGSSGMIDYLSILGVTQLATAANRLSSTKGEAGSVSTVITADKFENGTIPISKLEGTQITFGTYNSVDSRFNDAITLSLPTSYTTTDPDTGKKITHTIDYTADPKDLVVELNKALDSEDFMAKDKGMGSGIHFVLTGDGKLTVEQTSNISEEAKGYSIKSTSSALGALGFDSSKLSADQLQDGISLKEFNDNTGALQDSYVENQKVKEYLVGKGITISFGGQKKNIELIKDEEELKNIHSFDDFKNLLQKKINKAFGSGKVTVGEDNSTGGMSFVASNGETLTINADSVELRKILGIEVNQSNKISLDSSLAKNKELLGFDPNMSDEALKKALENFTINGVKLKGVTADTTVNELMSMINENQDMGVKVFYMSGTNQFSLTSTETGSGREIELGGAAETIFGVGKDGRNEDGKDAEIIVSYGNGVNTKITSSTNSFDLEGLNVTVSGVFGAKDVNDTSAADQAVTFSAAADVDTVAERVKKFVEDYNSLIKEINSQVTTKPNGNYGPLTDAQKEEMDDKSIENWEKKAKEGLLFGNSTLRDLSISVQGVITELMGNGVSYEKLEKIGISISDDYTDGGTLKFDENKFKSAMTSDPELVSNIFTGGGDVKKGLVSIVEDTLSSYATRWSYKNGGSYGILIEEAGSEKISLSLTQNSIYSQLEEMQKTIDKLNARLKTEQDRYISQFTQMETLINQMNSQAGYLASMTG